MQALDSTAETKCSVQERLIEEQAALRAILAWNRYSLRFKNKNPHQEQNGITAHPRNIRKKFVELGRNSEQ
jgi:hypothetical protein